MLTFLIAAIVLAVAVSALILWPLFSGEDEKGPVKNPDIDIYKSQLEELKRDLASGAIGEAEAAAAEAEISRRLLDASAEEEELSKKAQQGLSKKQRIVLATVLGILVPVFALGIYMSGGRPGYPAQPYQGEESEAEQWVRYGHVYMQNERYPDAAEAFAEAIKLSPPRADLLEMYGEAVLFAGDGDIPDSAIMAFRKAVELDPSRQRSRYIIGEWLYRNGRPEEGVRMFIDLLEETEDDAFREHLDLRINQVIDELKALVESGEDLPIPPQPFPDEVTSGERAERDLEGMSEEQRAMVAQMVSGLAERLSEEPDDLEGWKRLIRSYAVLGEPELANEAVQTATLTFLTRPEALQQIMALTEELNLVRGPELPEDAKILEGVE